MSGLMKFVDIVLIIGGVFCIIVPFLLEMETKTTVLIVLVGVVVVVWSGYTLSKEIKATSKKGEISKLSEEREEIIKKLKKED